MTEYSALPDKRSSPLRLPRPAGFLHYVAYGLVYLSGPVIFLLLMAMLDQPFQLDDAYLVSPEAYAMGQSTRPPSVGWQSDPAEFPATRGDDDKVTSIWFRYRIDRNLPVPVLYFPFPLANLDIWYQGERLHTLGSLTEPLPYYRSPLLVPLPSKDVNLDNDTLHVRVVRHARRTNPPQVYVASFEAAQRDFDGQVFTLDVIPAAMLVVMATFGIIVFSLFLTGRQIPACGWYSLMILLWSLNTGHRLVDDIPMLLAPWFALGYLCLNWIVVELLFVNRFFSIPAPRLEKGAIIASAIACTCLLVTAIGLGFEAMNVVNSILVTPLFFVCALLVTSRYFVALKRDWTNETFSLWLMSGIFIGVGVRDILYSYEAPWVPGSNYYLQYVAVLPIVLFGWYLIRRFASALRIANLRTAELDTTVAARTAELEKSYALLAAEERRRSVLAERSRLMRDMHDGLGGQLVHALALSEQGDDKDLQYALRDALDDLRMVVDSLTPDYDGIPELLASYRHRVSQALERSGTNIVWDIDEFDERARPDAKQALNVLRILQEAVTNAVRHSKCRTIEVSLKNIHDEMHLTINDDGSGFSGSTTGRGLKNMRLRAREIGAELVVESTDSGTSIQCRIPLGDHDG